MAASSGIARTPLLRGALVGAAALAAFCASAPQASAQFGFYVSRDGFYDEPLPLIPPRAVAYRLQSRGFSEISRPRFDGTAYVIDATSPVGTRVRLFVDAQNGAVIGRRTLDVPYYPSAREARPAPGYGWTEEDVVRRRTARAGEGLVPPADIPDAAPSRPSKQAALGPAGSPRAGTPDGNPLGANPDAKAHAAPPSKKTARLSQPQKPAVPNPAPAAPAPKIEAADKAKPEAAPEPKQDTATVAPPKAEPATPEPAKSEPAKAEPTPPTPAANQEAVEKPAADAPTADTTKADTTKAEAPKQDKAKQDQAWRDPTPDESKRKVRVIDGATVVPGSGDAAPAATN